MLAIFSPSEDFTHWLLMKSPVGCVHERPLGAVHCTFNEAIVEVANKSCASKVGFRQRYKAFKYNRQSAPLKIPAKLQLHHIHYR